MSRRAFMRYFFHRKLLAAINKRHAVLSVVVSLNKHPRILLSSDHTLGTGVVSCCACFGAPAFLDAVLSGAIRLE
ncbi:hypothetical protein ACOSQ4_028448 [Xanthoceras sorbifolium]